MNPESLLPQDRSDRRAFLQRALTLGASTAIIAACSSGDDPADSSSSSSSSTSSSSSSSSTSSSSSSSSSTSPSTSAAESAAATDAPAAADEVQPLTAAMFEALAVCALTPSSTAGPFPNVERLDRQDITEGYPGHPLRLGFRVVDENCVPIPGAAVHIWHCDATGDYSAYDDNGTGKDEGRGTNFCRGVQTANDAGIAEFHTIYPGWYSGRAVHIHLQVDVDGREVLTSQVYFDEQYTLDVFSTGVYAEFGPPDTTWSNDRISGSPEANGTVLSLSPGTTIAGPGTLGLINLGVSV